MKDCLARRAALFLAAAGLLAATAVPSALAQSPRGTAEGEVDGVSISIDYGRPSLNGRDMLGQAADGMVWRLGADAATTITTSGPLMIGETELAAGAYTLFARKHEGGWNLLVNSQTGQWGTEHDASQDIAEIPLSVGSGSAVEQFTINVGEHMGATMLHFTWGETVLMATVSGG